MLRSSTPGLADCIEVGVRHEGRDHWQPSSTTFSLTPGKLVALIGPSGCGKSSLTLTLNGLVPHSVPSVYRGSVLVRGEEVADQRITQLATTVAMVLQDPDSQIVTTRVLDEVTWGLSNLCLPVEEIRTRARDALDLVGLLDQATRNPWELSGGQRQRLVLAAALAMHPDLLVLDEPTANIDPATGEHIHEILAETARRGTAVLVVEHDLDPIIGHVDEVIALDAAGTTLAQGPPREVLHRHRDLLLAAGISLPSCVRLSATIPELSDALTIDEGITVLNGNPAAREALHRQLDQLTPPEADAVGVQVDDLSLSLPADGGPRTVLDRVSCHAPAGAITAVIGVNGAGKSTLLRALAGLHPRTRVRSCHTRSGPLSLNRPDQRVGYVFQNPQHQFLRSTLREELAHSGQISHLPTEQVMGHVEHLLDRLGLADKQDLNPFLLSGGQQRRLSVATALSERREVLCLDEPTFGQDAASTRTLLELLTRTAAEGTTVVMATHDLGLVLEHAAHVILLHEGRVVTQGRPAEVLADKALTDSGLIPPPLLQLSSAPAGVEPQPVSGESSQGRDLPEPPPSPIGPLTLFLGLLPAMFLTLTASRHEFSLSCLLLCSVLLLFTGRGRPAGRIVLVASLWALAALLTWSGLASYRFDLHGTSELIRVGPFLLDQGQWLAGIRLGLRISAMLALILVSGSFSTPQDLLKALTRTCHLPVRIAHAGMAAVAFMERLQSEHRIIRQARRLRGSRAPAWLRPVVIWAGSVVPLMVGAVRHAERVSMAMDARAFGAHRTRTELTVIRWRLLDTVMLLTSWVATLAVALILNHLDLLGRIGLELRHHG